MIDNDTDNSIAVVFKVPATSVPFILNALTDAAAEVQRVVDDYPPVSVNPDSPRPHVQQARHSLMFLAERLRSVAELRTSESK